MNKHSLQKSLKQAFTLIEISVAMGLLGIVGGIIYTVLNGGMILFSKNVATNYSNLSVRTSSMRMLQDLHESVGRPELVKFNSAGAIVPSTDLSDIGIRFPVLVNDNATEIISDGSGSKNINTVSPNASVSLKIKQQTNAPRVGDILVLPDVSDALGNVVVRKITAVVAGNPTTVTVKDLGVNVTLAEAPPTPVPPTIAYVARLAGYCLVKKGVVLGIVDGVAQNKDNFEMRYYPDISDVTKYTVINNNLETYIPLGGPTPIGPFSITPTGSNVPGVAQVQLMSINADTGARAYRGDSMLLNEIIPPKSMIISSTNYN